MSKCFAHGCTNEATTEYCGECLRNGGIKPTVKMFKTVVKENLSFGEAMIECVENKKKVARAHWGGYWKYTQFACFKNPLIAATLKDNGGVVPATPYQEDMTAKDWMVVE